MDAWTHREVGRLSTHWVGGEGGRFKNARGGEPAHDATVTTHWHHNFGGWRLAFCLLVGTYLGFQLWRFIKTGSAFVFFYLTVLWYLGESCKAWLGGGVLHECWPVTV